MRPCELGFMLAVYAGVKDWEVKGSETRQSTIENLLEWDLIESDPERRAPTGYRPTERGEAFVEMLKATPLPEHRWIDPRTEKA